MIAFFCEECGGRNTVDSNTLDPVKSHIECRFCHELVPFPKISKNARGKKPINTKSFKILVVDDEEEHRELFKMILEDEYSIITASGGVEALRLASEANPDLILLDVMMPEMRGDEICRKLKANRQTRHIPVIFVTFLADVIDEKKGLEAGAVDYITKPVKLPIAKARIAIHLELKRQFDHRKKESLKFYESVKWLEKQVMKHQLAKIKEQQTKSELAQTLDAVDDIVTIQDNKKRIIRVNKAACCIFQKSSDELVDKYCYEIFCGTSKPCDNCPGITERSDSDAKPIKIVNEMLGKTFLINHLPRFDDQGVLIGFIHVARENSLSQMVALYTQNKSMEKAADGKVRRGYLNRANIDNLLTVVDNLNIILLNNELMRNPDLKDADISIKTQRISEAVSRASMLIAETISEAFNPNRR